MTRLVDRIPIALAVGALLTAACGGGADANDAAAPESTSAAPPTTAATPEDVVAGEPIVEEVAFQSDGFNLVGDLVLPTGTGPFPAVIVVHGSGPQTRYSTPGRGYIVERFGSAGYAVLTWDKPGTGSSTGSFDEGETLRQRAQILADGVEFLTGHPAIDPTQIGLWGISQAGWVMPLALELTDDVEFMIVVSGGGEDSIEQLGYRIGAELVCGGLPPEQGELVARYGPQAAKGTTYREYVEAMEILLDIPGMDQYVGPGMSSEEDWQPWPPEIDAYVDPMDIIEDTTIPILAVFGELDKSVDPLQGAAAYEEALQKGNPHSHVELIPGVGHTLQRQSTGCAGDPPGGYADRYIELIDEWLEMLAG